MTRPAWMARSRCAAEYGPGFDKELAATQVACCIKCPVRAQCLEYALEHETPGRRALSKFPSIWGGKTVNERRALLASQERRAAA